MNEQFRPNSGIVVFNAKGLVLLCRRADISDAWQFPQGGIDKNEKPEDAAKRELKEETSLTNVVLIATTNQPVRYRFPPEVIASTAKRGWHYVGQEMHWFLFYFGGSDAEINLDTDEREFVQYKWTSLKEAYDLVVDFKKPAYAPMIEIFAKKIADFRNKKSA